MLKLVLPVCSALNLICRYDGCAKFAQAALGDDAVVDCKVVPVFQRSNAFKIALVVPWVLLIMMAKAHPTLLAASMVHEQR